MSYTVGPDGVKATGYVKPVLHHPPLGDEVHRDDDDPDAYAEKARRTAETLARMRRTKFRSVWPIASGVADDPPALGTSLTVALRAHRRSADVEGARLLGLTFDRDGMLETSMSIQLVPTALEKSVDPTTGEEYRNPGYAWVIEEDVET